MKTLHLAGLMTVAVLATPAAVLAQPPLAAPAEPPSVRLYGDASKCSAEREVWNNPEGMGPVVRNVTCPTLTPVLPDPAKATGAAVIVAPGGGFMLLSIKNEGWDVARALADRGIAAFVLKYRLLPTPTDWAEARSFMFQKVAGIVANPYDNDIVKRSQAPADGKAAVAWVRANAAKYGIDPDRVGMMGFSAGAMTARRVGLDANAASRPAFVGYVYGPQNAEVVPADAPPMFDAIALDDNLFPFTGFPIVQAYLDARRPVEVHGYQKGNHGFGLGVPGTTTTLMIDQFTAWLRMQGFLTPKDAK